MAARKPVKRAPTRRKKQRSWRIPKILLFVSYSAALVALGSLFFMKTELQRFKSPDRERAVAPVVTEKKTPVATPVAKPKSEVRATTAPRVNEPSAEEKKPQTETRTAVAPRASEPAVEEKNPQGETRPVAAPHAGEITADEKKQLENILRSRGSQ
jgi:hypothetical protein